LLVMPCIAATVSRLAPAGRAPGERSVGAARLDAERSRSKDSTHADPFATSPQFI